MRGSQCELKSGVVAQLARGARSDRHRLITASTILTRPLTPLLTLAAYGSLIISAFSALIALILASYGLSAWDDAKHKLIGVRALIGKGLDVGKEIVGAVTSTAFHQPLEPNGSSRATTMPRRAPDHADRPAPTSAASDRLSACSPKQSRPTTGYDVPSMDDDEQPEAEHHPTRSGRSAQKNPTNAFRNAQRAYNQRPSILRKSSSYAAHPYSSPTR
ncbi:hypothetical protein PtA15_7A711 [Puccinia triticina]|uniref:H(+)-exporting diphosphatase n=1 Tax=Puccinia triticina TaxID=208348 RepID=A0ABY7CW79_9BASI|nr:uncharacterized protein PtA15_7A711 [Puccinia triticina]WAQ86982.1 hypothetical protein PtA15_7A711 [Puccinia triticina]